LVNSVDMFGLPLVVSLRVKTAARGGGSAEALPWGVLLGTPLAERLLEKQWSTGAPRCDAGAPRHAMTLIARRRCPRFCQVFLARLHVRKYLTVRPNLTVGTSP
jgi:hypothetical protein